jgi:nucleoid DNA-binding protein
MTKQEFVDKVQQAAGIDQSKAATTAVIEAVFDSVADVVKKEHSFRWHGFGTFEIRKRAARKGHNPQTGEPIKIKASTTVAFRPAAALKEGMGTKSKAKAKPKAKATKK